MTTAIHVSHPPLATPSRLASRLPYFVALMKPRVMALAVFTAFVGMLNAPSRVDPLLGFVAIGPDNTNNVLALAFGILIVLLVVVGSTVIMANLNENLMPSPEVMNLHMQH